MKWRKWLRILHRDLGFLCVGLTIVYAVSGIATNHRADWDYNASSSHQVVEIGRPSELLGRESGDEGALARGEEEALVPRIAEAVGRKTLPRKVIWRGRDLMSLFYGEGESDVVDYRPTRGLAGLEVREDRFLIRDFNFLHLNESRAVWTWFADGFALLLIFLAISGAVIVKGRKGLWGRGGIYTLVGILIPLLAILLLR